MPQVATALDAAGKAVDGLEHADVHVTITQDTGFQPLKVFSCFFYMH